MIRFLKKNDINAVISLWEEAFGDSGEDIAAFLDRFSKYMLINETESTVASMLTLIPVTLNGEKGRYVYAVATKKEFRGKGFAGKLIEYAKMFVEREKEKFLVILPQNSGLFGFYEKFGFAELKCAVQIKETVSFKEKSGIKVNKIRAGEYFECRKKYFGGKNYVEWSKEMLDFFEEIYRGTYLKISKNGKDIGYAFCYTDGNIAVVSELLTAETEISSEIGHFFGKAQIVGVKDRKNGERFAMIYPKELKDCYFGIGMN